MKELLIFRKGWPDYKWERFFDRRLSMDVVMREDCSNVYERMYDGELRYVKIT